MTSPKPSHKNKTGFTPNGETFRLLFANHPIPMWIYDWKHWRFWMSTMPRWKNTATHVTSSWH